MLSHQRAATVAAVVAAGLVLGAAPAFAGDSYGTVTCDQTPSPLCELEAGANGSGEPGHAPSTSGPDHPGGSAPSAPAPREPGDTITGGDSGQADCSYVKSDYQPPAGGVATIALRTSKRTSDLARPVWTRAPRARTAAPGEAPGAWYLWRCTGEGTSDALYRPPRWIPDDKQLGAALLPSPAELAQSARKQLRLPSPTIATSPTQDQLVHLPTWLWLSGGWRAVSATASVPGVAVTAVAAPLSVIWSMGDGTTVTCSGAGTPYPVNGDPRSPSPDCGHVYRRSSAGHPAREFPVTATVRWQVTWSGAGQGGAFPDMTTGSTTSFRVLESQALNGHGG
ncbi:MULTISPECIES: hypothetical protein [Actinosynnema]|uniref:hypothetical protein n=1 Tax=Actinosynnema TaxID=40566 RepID=UPI0020A53D51|nr:hypothetical protein [Actinosynnema pretiosum]MCP2098081.1 hypothetical protein [Actinosynnema pretiosum]